jgi:hypothetical protein
MCVAIEHLQARWPASAIKERLGADSNATWLICPQAVTSLRLVEALKQYYRDFHYVTWMMDYPLLRYAPCSGF